MDQVDQFKDNSALNYPKQSVSNSQNKDGWKQMGFEEKKAAVNEEMGRMNQLPANSSYVIHRSRVLNKIMQLLSVQNLGALLNMFLSCGMLYPVLIWLSYYLMHLLPLNLRVQAIPHKPWTPGKTIVTTFGGGPKKRTTSQDAELELLFAGLSL